jgi:hypothetical protein
VSGSAAQHDTADFQWEPTRHEIQRVLAGNREHSEHFLTTVVRNIPLIGS